MKTFAKINQIFCAILCIINLIIAYKSLGITREANRLRDTLIR